MAVPKRFLLLAAAAWTWFSQRYAPAVAISQGYIKNTIALFAIAVFVQLAWSIVVYPLFLSPLRHLPSPPDGHFLLGHFRRIYKDPTGEPQRDWIDNVPNDGVLYYRWLFNEPRILVTNPKAIGEVLVTRSYEFVKPGRLRKGLGRLLGVGILLAEGDEHKVRIDDGPQKMVTNVSAVTAPEKGTYACVQFPTRQRFVPDFLE